MTNHRPPGLRGRTEERGVLDRLLEHVRGGQSGVLVVRGDPGRQDGAPSLCASQAAGFRVVQIGGVESEMELPFAGLHQLCGRCSARLDALPGPQRTP